MFVQCWLIANKPRAPQGAETLMFIDFNLFLWNNLDMKLTCSKCGLKNDRLPQRYCRKCHAANMRANRPKHQDLPELQRKKANARAYANVYLMRGLIQKMPCITCGNENAEKHHPDYDKPLQIVWLCKVCHIKHHRSET